MSSLAEQALEHARLRLAGKLPASPTTKAPKINIPPTSPQPVSLGVVVDGPINNFMYLEGRRHALDLASSLSALPTDEVIKSLTRSAVGRPSSYALGIKSIMNAIQASEIQDPGESDHG